MARYFGFEPDIKDSDFYFISYNSEDAERIAPIARILHDKGLPLWYDKGILHDTFWAEEISKRIATCNEVILFVTQGIFDKGHIRKFSDIYTYKEYDMARNTYGKKMLIVHLDYISNPPYSLAPWLSDLRSIQGIDAVGMDAEAVASGIIGELSRDKTGSTHEEGFHPVQKVPAGNDIEAEFLHMRGKKSYDEGKYDEAAECFVKAIKMNYAPAMVDYGRCYIKGNGVHKNYSTGLKWIQRAIELGSPAGMNAMGVCYKHGYGVPQNYEKAVEWFRKAAEQGHAAAQFNLGDCYHYGKGVPQSYEKAAEWWTKAAEQGHATAQFNIGVLYHKGRGVIQNDETAVEWYSKAAEQGIAAAQFNLGVNYERGWGVPQSYEKAAEWYAKAAEQGHADAQFKLGSCYYYGEGVPQNYEKAVEWYTKSAGQGNKNAQYSLGYCFEHGEGVPQSKEKAIEWYTKAAGQGLVSARERLEKLK